MLCLDVGTALARFRGAAPIANSSVPAETRDEVRIAAGDGNQTTVREVRVYRRLLESGI
jgi:hypothetical protein